MLIDVLDFKGAHLLVPTGSQLQGTGGSTDGLTLRIDGVYDGSLNLGAGSGVLIGVDAVVNCESLTADRILIEGRVHGNVTANRMLELMPSARVTGSISYAADLAIHPGARVTAQLQESPQQP